jgi:hypothetical protein
MLTILRTPVYRSFRRRIGNCTFHINSAYIGLEWIARGKGRPSDLSINWDAPKKPRESVDQARQLIHSAMLGHVSDALDSYLRLLADVSWIDLTNDQRDIMRKSVTRPGKGAYSISERFAELKLGCDNDAKIDFALLKVLVAWRNQRVHDGLAGAGELRLPDGCEETLLEAKAYLAGRYGGLDPEVLLANMRNRAAPKRKEIIGLVSACQNLVGTADSVLLERSLCQTGQIKAVALEKIKEALCHQSASELKKLWGKDPAARARRVKAILEASGFTEANADTAAVACLPNEFVERFAERSVQQVLSVLGVEV